MENSFKSIIDQSKSVLIVLPTKPYFDQVAAGLALFLSLRNQKDIQIYSPSPMTVEFNRLVGVNKITGEMGNKNLIIRFLDYRANDIERVSYDIEDSQFRLTVIPKPRVAPPAKEQVSLAYSGVAADTVVLIGGANETHFPAISTKELTAAAIVHIGTKDLSFASNKGYLSFARPASSICEVMADLIKESGAPLDEDVATNLLVGIEKTTVNFTENSVTAQTFAIVADLMKSGGKRLANQMVAQRADFPPGSIPGSLPKFAPQRDIQNWPQPKFQGGMQPQPLPAQPQPAPESSVDEDKAPEDWLQPKIYKGTSVS